MFYGRVIVLFHRFDDVEDKWVVAPEGLSFSAEEIMAKVQFRERCFQTTIEVL